MTIYLVNILLLSIWGFLFLSSKNKHFGMFIALACIQWILLSGLRDVSIGADTKAYEWYFTTHQSLSWDQILQYLKSESFGIQRGTEIEAGYMALEKLTFQLGGDFRVFLFVIAILFTVPLGLFVLRNSEDPYLSFLLYSCLFFSFFAITGCRQVVATSIAVFGGHKFARQKAPLRFLICLFLGFLFHKSAIFFLPMYAFYRLRYSSRLNTILILLLPVAAVASQLLLRFMAQVSSYDYGYYDAGSVPATFTLLLVLVLLVTMWRWPYIANKENVTPTFYAVFGAVYLVPLVFINPSMMRVVQYYSLSLLLLIPHIVYSFQGKNRKIVYLAVSVMLILLFINTRPFYQFA